MKKYSKILLIIPIVILWIVAMAVFIGEIKSPAESPAIPQIVVQEEKPKDLYQEACGELGDQCAKDLKAIAIKESGEDDNAIGDGGTSYGRFQIHLPAHPEITIEQATDPEFSADWSTNRLVAYGYPEYRAYAIQCHNGCVKNNGYALSVINISATL